MRGQHRKERRPWVLSTVEDPGGCLSPALCKGLGLAQDSLLAAAGTNPFLWESIALAIHFMGAPEEHPVEEVA